MVRVERHPLRGGAQLYLAVARGETVPDPRGGGAPRRPLPANGGLRVVPERLADPAARALCRRLAVEMLAKHRLHHTGFWGAKMLVTGADRVDDELLRAVAVVLESWRGGLYTGADMGVTAQDMARLAQLSPYVLNAVGSRVQPNAATAHGVLGAVDAWAGGPVAGLRVLVHGVGKVGRVLAQELAAAGATVLTCDLAPGAAEVPGCRPVQDWAAEPVDLLLPCSVADLIGPQLAGRLRCGAIIGSANAVLAHEAVTRAVLRGRGIEYLPGPLVNAGAVIVDSIEHYAPAAFRAAEPGRVYGFVRGTVRRAVQRRRPEAGPFCGLRFAGG